MQSMIWKKTRTALYWKRSSAWRHSLRWCSLIRQHNRWCTGWSVPVAQNGWWRVPKQPVIRRTTWPVWRNVTKPERETASFWAVIWLPWLPPTCRKNRERWLPNTWIPFLRSSWLPKRTGIWWKSMSVIHCQVLWKKSCRIGINFMRWPVKRWLTIN